METITTEVMTGERARDQRGHWLYSEERKAELITAYEQSGLTRATFARREGLSYTTFCGWLQGHRGAAKRKKAAPRVPRPMRFVEANLPAMFGGLEISLPDGTKLRGASAKELAELLRALRSQSGC